VAAYFLDTSTVVKRYAQETGTPWVQAMAAPAARHLLTVVRITLAETIAAVTRKERARLTTAQDAANALNDSHVDFAHQYVIVEVSAGLVHEAATLARRHALRGYDAVQLAAALQVHSQIPSLTLLSADANLNTSAMAERRSVDNPNNHP